MSKRRTVPVERLAETLKALSNPHRLRMLVRLVECCGPGGGCCGEDGDQDRAAPSEPPNLPFRPAEGGAGSRRSRRTAVTEEGAGQCVGEVAEGLGVCPSTVSHHLKELRAAGLIRMERRGRTVECSVDRGSLEELSRFFSGLVPGDGPEDQ